MAKRKLIEQPVVIKVGKVGEFQVTYRRVQRDEGPAAEFFGFVDGKRVKILRFDDFEHDPHYHYNPDTPKDKKYSIDPAFTNDPHRDLCDLLYRLSDMVKSAGYNNVAKRIRRSDQYSQLSDAINKTLDAMNVLRYQAERIAIARRKKY